MKSLMMKRAALFLVLATSGCGAPKPAASVDSAPKDDEPATKTDDSTAKEVPVDAVEKAARPFTGYRVFDDKVFSHEMILTMLAGADAICFGESHDSVLDHYAELEVVRGLSERRKVRGYELLVGLEMIRTEFQPNLDYYFQSPVPFSELAPKVNFETEWGYPRPFYAPIIETAGLERNRLIALGLARQVSRTVARGGIEALPPEQREALPDLDFAVPDHRRLFDEAMQSHPPVAEIEQYYQVQVIWDESMAERSVGYLADRSPARKMLILAGAQHCHRSGVPSRMKRRAPHLKIASLRVREGAPLAEDSYRSGYDFELVF
jgi:uncharacterized iron-regulated protein